MDSDFLKLTPIFLFLSLALLMAPKNIKIIKDARINGIKFSISINDVVFIFYLLFFLYIVISLLRAK